MNASEKLIKLSARMYECRDTAKFLLGFGYAARMAEIQEIIRSVMQREHVDEMQACLLLLKGSDDGHLIMQVTAAMVEMIEPSEVAK